MKAGDTVKAGGSTVATVEKVDGDQVKVRLPGGVAMTLPASYLTVVAT